MKKFSVLAVAFALLASTSVAGELKSGLEPGQRIGAFQVVKCAGADEDGVKVGEQLCYRCQYGGRPMVMVFSRSADASVAQLAAGLNDLVAKNTDSEVKAFVNLLGEDRESLEGQAKEFGTSNKLAVVPVVVPVEFENGPDNYGINPKAEVTVIVAKGSKVTGNYAFGKGEFNEKAAKKLLAEVPGDLK